MLTVKKLLKKRPALKWLFVLVMSVSTISLSIHLDRLQNPPSLGYADWLSPSDWDASSISRFLGVRIPTDATDLQIQGAQGREGSYGVQPRLQFSFRAPPQSAMAFIATFCNGDLYSGYNPLTSTESDLPSSAAVLIRGAGTVHYSRSPSIPTTTFGNRCARQGWLEEIVIDKSDSYLYTVSYRLPYEANVNPAEYYPTAQYVRPFDTIFRLYVTGLRQEQSKDGTVFYSLSYPTICFETASLALVYDYWSFNPKTMTQFEEATVTIRVDGVPQPSAKITEEGNLIVLSSKDNNAAPSRSNRWNYCLAAHWNTGSHSIQFIVTSRQGSTQVFQWTVKVKPTILF